MNKQPDFIPHDGFAGWEIIPGYWLQVAEGKPTVECGPLRFGIEDLEEEKNRLIKQLNINDFEINSRGEVPVKWGTFTDPWGLELGSLSITIRQRKVNVLKQYLGIKFFSNLI
ncbi:VOC family protein [Lysinibacillus xylanilyticus]|uniref:VOC family protein n=1 Tax=Lysinibacillus xylanilyticus TaxID=582475 RepID=UPI0036DE69A1